MAPAEQQHSKNVEHELRLQELEETVASFRSDLRRAIQAQEELQAQLKLAVEELSNVRRNGNAKARAFETATQIQRIESRLRGFEQRLDRIATQVTGILQSRIWRTLMKGGGILMRFTK